MSQENVEIVRQFQPPPDMDLALLVRDEDMSTAWIEAAAPFFHADAQCVIHVIGVESVTHPGVGGLRTAWLDWLTPWASYRSNVERLIDAGEHVVVLVRDFGRDAPDAPEVEMIAAAVWTVREGKISRVEFFADRAEALKAVGLED